MVTDAQRAAWFTVPIYGRAGIVAYAKLDRVDEAIASRRWNLSAQGYAKHSRKSVLMHRLVVDPPEGMEVDHINGDRLDNRRANLRVATRAQQNQNRAVHRTSRTGVRNVHQERSGRFSVSVRCAGVRVWGGSFATIEEAAEAATQLRSVMFTHANEGRYVNQ